MDALALTTAIAALANGIAAQLSDEDLDFLTMCIGLLGGNLEAIAVQRALRDGQLEVHKTDASTPPPAPVPPEG